jgi:hypothetical protein
VSATRRIDASEESAEAEFRCETVDGLHTSLYGQNGLQVSGERLAVPQPTTCFPDAAAGHQLPLACRGQAAA